MQRAACSVQRAACSTVMIILFVFTFTNYHYHNTSGGELWAWRSYQGRIDLRCARCSNVE